MIAYKITNLRTKKETIITPENEDELRETLVEDFGATYQAISENFCSDFSGWWNIDDGSPYPIEMVCEVVLD